MGDVCSYDVPHAEADAVSVPKHDHVQTSVEVLCLSSCHCLCYDTAQ
jgi:hypothetical protein